MSDRPLVEVLERSKELGFLGPGPVDSHIRHADGFVAALPAPVDHLIDLGSGGGLPGLVIAWRRTDIDIVLVDVNERRCAFLQSAAESLGRKLVVVNGPAEEVARPGGTLRNWADVVTARSFGPPALTAEIGAGLLCQSGRLVVSEPPDVNAITERWDPDGLAVVGLSPATSVDSGGVRLAVMRKNAPTPERYPRRLPRMRREPLFD